MADPIERLRAQRESWLDLDGGKRLKIIRPPETQFSAFAAGAIELEHVQKYVAGWEGFTEADLFGDGSGTVAFTPELWAEFVSDDVLLMKKVALRLAELLNDYLEKKKAALGN
jgi:hypothetical protein